MPSRINPNRTSPPRPPANHDDERPPAAAHVPAAAPVPGPNPGTPPSPAGRQTALQARLIRRIESAQGTPPPAPQPSRPVSWQSAVDDRVMEDELGLAPQLVPDTQVSTDLGASVAAWMPPAMGGVDITEVSLRWQGFSAELGATAFAVFLDQLRGTVNSASPQFQRSVAEWLSHLEANPQLRQDTFALSEGATASCEDRVSHTFNGMRQLRLSSDVARGAFDGRLPELLTLGRSMFRLDQLETIAREYAAAMPYSDELEIHLAYQVMLRERLALPLDTQAMRFPDASEVTEAHIRLAHVRVLEAEQQNFANFLSNDWQPWQSVLRRLAPEQHAQAQEQLMDAMGEEFSSRLNARLQASGLQHDADAQRIVGPQIQAEITHEIYGRVTRDFLASRGLLSSLEP